MHAHAYLSHPECRDTHEHLTRALHGHLGKSMVAPLPRAQEALSDNICQRLVTRSMIPLLLILHLACLGHCSLIQQNSCPSGSLHVADTVTAIEEDLYISCSGITNAAIPDSVTYMGASSFYNCTGLASVTLSDSLQFIGESSFELCISLVRVTIPNSVTYMGASSFNNCSKLQSITIPDLLSHIGAFTFVNCYNLQNITIPDSVSEIGSNAFRSCSSLSSITIPDSVVTIRTSAFQSCTSVYRYSISDSAINIDPSAFAGNSALKMYNCNFTIPHGARRVPAMAMFELACYTPAPLIIPDTVTVIGPFAFYQSGPFTTIHIPDSVTTIGANVFYAAAGSVSQIAIPDSVTSVGSGAIGQLGDVTSVIVSPRVAYINLNAFAYSAITTQCSENPINGTVICSCKPGFTPNGRDCHVLTQCDDNEYEAVLPTFSTDRQCREYSSACNSRTEYQAVAPTMTTNRMCKPLLSTGDRAGIAIGVLLALVAFGATTVYLVKRRKATEKDLSLHQHLLDEEREHTEVVAREVVEMKRAWEIAEKDVEMHGVIASGGFGSVWRATWGHMDVAVKVMRFPVRGDGADLFAAGDFEREVTFMQRMRHPNLVMLFGAGINASNQPFLVLELMPQGSLRALLRSSRQLLWPMRERIAADIASGMCYLHEHGSIHRDLKSDNCLIDGSLRAKVGDFGTSHLAERVGGGPEAAKAALINNAGTERTRTRMAETVVSGGGAAMTPPAALTKGVGTLFWKAPELFESGCLYGSKVDVYSYGIVMWEITTRVVPWEREIDVKLQGIQFVDALVTAVKRGDRPTIHATDECPENFLKLMQRCWSGDASTRPTFRTIKELLASEHHC